MISRHQLAPCIDHTLLKPDATGAQVVRLCQEAVEWGFFAVCVSPIWVRRAARELAGSKVAVATVVGFPSGGSTSLAKGVEAVEAVAAGASEIDMVGPIGRLVEGDVRAYREDVEAVVKAVGPSVPVKVILETGFLTDPQKEQAARAAVEAGAAFVKTSTGFGPGGATAGDVRLLARVVDGRAKVKASGGIRTLALAIEMIEAGASRLGTSSSVSIMRELSAGS